MSNKNLWGELPNVEHIRTPHAILKGQASNLTELTEGLLVGDVTRHQQDAMFTLTLRIQAPPLNNYIFTVLSVRHQIELYPATIQNQAKPEQPKECKTESEFEDALGVILSSIEVKKVVGGLLAQIRADSQRK